MLSTMKSTASSIWHALASFIRVNFGKDETDEATPAPVSKSSVILIAAYPRTGVITISHKGQIKTGKFQDNTVKRLLRPATFDKGIQSFLGAQYQLLEQLIKQK